ncbi:response regulator transcription factor [uncultured Porticoccus sp.]|uniref:response regulator transcription factor n=1 Tax=uncultured Porticoccus sp. TaxID=1256050 RepID=UPI003418B097
MLMPDNHYLLIVDDDATFTRILGRAMTRRSYQVLTAGNAAEALDLCRQYNPRRAVVDLKLESESGLHLLPQLIRINPQLEVLILTGYSSISTAVEAIKLGALNYLCKPASVEDILAAFDTDAIPEATGISEDPPSVERLEWEHIQRVLAENAGNISATARRLGMHRRTLQRKLQKRPVKQ